MRSPKISGEALSKMRRLRSDSIGSASAKSWDAGAVGEKTRLLERHFQQSSSGPRRESMFEPGTEPPPLMQWLAPAMICALMYALYNIFIKKGSASIHPILGGVVLQIVAAALGALLCGYLVYGPTQEPMFYDVEGFSFAILAGIAVGAAEILSFVVNGMGVPAVQSIPVIIGGSVMFGTVIGRVFLAEILSPRGWFGVVLIATGITLVGMESE